MPLLYGRISASDDSAGHAHLRTLGSREAEGVDWPEREGDFIAMAAWFRIVHSVLSSVCSRSGVCSRTGQFRGVIVALLLALPLLSAKAPAQTTTIGGTVYDPRTTAGALPLPNVLVYVTTALVAPLPSGVQCLTASTPSGVVSYTNTAVDGTFTLANVPENATYTLVIQAGKWRRQFSETVAAAPLTGLALHMPADHTQGDIPLIAIATGSADALECVFRDMGIADTEFTDDNGTTNAGGRIHLYQGSGSTGALINASTPSQTTLMGTATDSSLINSYDMVMFPCQGGPSGQTNPIAATNLLNYANTGGRVFNTHYSYAWLDPNTPYNSLFPPVANWDVGQMNPQPDPGIATVSTNFTDGATLAQWLQNAGASYNNTPGQIQISTLRHDFDGVIPPTQPWLTDNDSGAGNPVMQMTFNAPVGAPAANQCGRVLYNEYHVIEPIGFFGEIYPSECPPLGTMSAQEEMLEYALFDLSSFVTPVVVPTLSITFNPSPLIVKQGDTADQVTVDTINTSTSAPVDSAVVITFAPPLGLTITALADAAGGWNCTLSTLSCARTTIIAAGASDAVTMTVSVPAYTAGSSTTGVLTATASSPNFSNNVTASDTVIFQQPPTINWATPAPIIYGTPLSGAQLDATSPLPGSFSYSPSAGTVLPVGKQTLTATFTPTDTTDYTIGTATVTLTVAPAAPAVTVSATPNPAFVLNPVAFTATIISYGVAPTGTVTFYDGTTLLGSVAISGGSATVTTSALTLGPHSITAVYSGDSSYLAATSGALAETIEDFTIALSGNSSVTGSASVPLGGVATYPLVITPVGGTTLAETVSLGVSGLPAGLAVVFTPATVAAGSAATNLTLQVGPPGKAALGLQAIPFGWNTLPVALGLILLPFAGRLRKLTRRWFGVVVLALAGAILAAGVTGCGVHMTPQSSTLTITASSGPLSHTVTVTLTVQ